MAASPHGRLVPALAPEGPGVGLSRPDATRAQTRVRAAVSEFVSQARGVLHRACPEFKCEPGPVNSSRSAQGGAGADR